MLGEPLSIGVGRIFLLDFRAVTEEQVRQIRSRRSDEDRSLKTLTHQPRKVSGMVNMSVGQDRGTQILRRKTRCLPISPAQFLFALKQSAIHEQLPGCRGH